MKYLVNLFIALITMFVSVHRIESDLSDQKQRNEKLTQQVIRLETIQEMHFVEKSLQSCR